MKIKFLNIVLFWLAFALFIAGVMTLVHPITNRPVNIWGELVWELAFSAAWIVGTPIALWSARRFSLQNELKLKNAISLFIIGITLSVFQCLLHGFLIYLFDPEAGVFHVNIFLTSLFYNIDKMLIVYSALVIMQHAMDFYRRFQEKEVTASKLETQLTQAQMQALKMQLQPHFLFNTLNAIVTLVRKDPDLAEEMVVRLSDFLRITLDSSGRQIVSLKEELEFIKAYLQIEEIRFSGRLTYVDAVPAELLDAHVPMLILQPLVENSVKHGFSKYEHAGTLTISAELSDGSINITVKDDAAPGIDLSKLTVGIGLTNTKNRLLALYGGNASVTIDPNIPLGVSVCLTLPYTAGNA
ncbi:MAG: sensor histidine kinase [Bacteroidota bacterium]